jgi:hypothetical protein
VGSWKAEGGEIRKKSLPGGSLVSNSGKIRWKIRQERPHCPVMSISACHPRTDPGTAAKQRLPLRGDFLTGGDENSSIGKLDGLGLVKWGRTGNTREKSSVGHLFTRIAIGFQVAAGVAYGVAASSPPSAPFSLPAAHVAQGHALAFGALSSYYWEENARYSTLSASVVIPAQSFKWNAVAGSRQAFFEDRITSVKNLNDRLLNGSQCHSPLP